METADFRDSPDTRVDQEPTAFPREDPTRTDTALWLARLRGEFPYWGILHDPFAHAWIAVRGRTRMEVARTAFELRDHLRMTAYVRVRSDLSARSAKITAPYWRTQPEPPRSL